jgi:hypothetical protein
MTMDNRPHNLKPGDILQYGDQLFEVITATKHAARLIEVRKLSNGHLPDYLGSLQVNIFPRAHNRIHVSGMGTMKVLRRSTT